MTAQEAIKDIRRQLAEIESEDADVTISTESLCMAIESLKKQIPKKVIFEDDGNLLLCPNCGLDLMGSIAEPDHDPYYCFECGQALLWEK